MFNNEIFDRWLNQKSESILAKVDHEPISTEEMIILILKAQTNHFHHMDQTLLERINEVNTSLNKKIDEINTSLDEKISITSTSLDQKIFELRKDMNRWFQWSLAILIPLIGGIYLKLFLR